MKSWLIIGILAITVSFSNAQKVGLVLSGGGAKGLAHIGVIKALEENNIPIDYITGTSMGAIVGSMYAAGYSPSEIEAIVCSQEFQNWAWGKIPDEFVYFFKRKENDASWIDLKFNYDTTFSASLPTNIIPPHSMDLAFLEMLSQASARANYNFDSLLIPFRCVASDVYANEAVIFSEGDVGAAVRASMTFPFYFKPITIKGKLLFDGGIYNNFPIDVMINHFKPDYIIGSVVASNSPPPSEDNILLQIENMIVTNSNYSVPDSNGILIKPDVKNVKLMDFHLAPELIKIGYGATMAQMTRIKQLIPVRTDTCIINERRNTFKHSFSPLIFKNIYISGLSHHQSLYILKFLKHKNDTLTFENFRKGYYKLISDDHIESIYPRAKFNENTGYFNLFLNVKREKPFKARIGGIISSDNMNGGFLGVEYKYLRQAAYSLYGNIYFGKLYSSLYGRLRIDNIKYIPFAWLTYIAYNQWDYYRGSSFLFYEEKRPRYILHNERLIGSEFSLPYKNQSKLSFGTQLYDFQFYYYQNQAFNAADTTDVTIFFVFLPYITFEKNSLNNIEFPTKGNKIKIDLRYYSGLERYKPGTTANTRENDSHTHSWFYSSIETLNLLNLTKKITTGLGSQLVYSNQPLFSTYTSTILISPAFIPHIHTRSIFTEAIRNPSFVAGKFLIQYKLTEQFLFQFDTYHFVPINPIIKSNNSFFVKNNSIGDYFPFFAANVIFSNPVANISFSVNYYPWNKNQIFGQFNIGYLIFNRSAHP